MRLLRSGIGSLGVSDKMNAREAIFGFMGWLTSSDCNLRVGSKHECSMWPELISRFADVNKLDKVSDDWQFHLIRPLGEVGVVVSEEEANRVGESEETFETLRDRRQEIENTVFNCLCENMGPFDSKQRVPHALTAEDIAFAVGKSFVDWCVHQRGITRDKNRNEVKRD